MNSFRMMIALWFLPSGFHICKNPAKGTKRKKKSSQVELPMQVDKESFMKP